MFRRGKDERDPGRRSRSSKFLPRQSRKSIPCGASHAAKGERCSPKSYAYADGLLDLVGFIAWATLILGGLALFAAIMTSGDPDTVVLFLIGVSGVMAGGATLTVVQIGRAVIDIAENTARTAAWLETADRNREPKAAFAEAGASKPS